MDLNIYYYNIDKIKTEHLEYFNREIDKFTEFQLIVLTETRVNGINAQNFNIINMETVTVLIKKGIEYKIIHTNANSVSFQFVFKSVKFNCHATYWSYGNCYDKNETKYPKFKRNMDELRTFHNTNNQNFILIGDLNLKYNYNSDGSISSRQSNNKWPSSCYDEFSRFIHNNQLLQKNKIKNQNESFLDIFFTNIKFEVKSKKPVTLDKKLLFWKQEKSHERTIFVSNVIQVKK